MGSTKVMAFELNGVQIKTTVTNEVKVIDEHISSFLHRTDNQRTKVIGFDIEWRPPSMLEPITINQQDSSLSLLMQGFYWWEMFMFCFHTSVFRSGFGFFA
ncbi:hypothetical protein TSUD_174690 [Trifolium subterraneum]|uniref:3'-5' exonuclease domain-containing protein n=1 Tax=Trifolium subterraneum TaxID=3900 RepID=A0A2Z6NIW9_TRISU|nr:hypothetical protein TSUD_174690 [Trifolium subterraneum]